MIIKNEKNMTHAIEIETIFCCCKSNDIPNERATRLPFLSLVKNKLMHAGTIINNVHHPANISNILNTPNELSRRLIPNKIKKTPNIYFFIKYLFVYCIEFFS